MLWTGSTLRVEIPHLRLSDESTNFKLKYVDIWRLESPYGPAEEKQPNSH